MSSATSFHDLFAGRLEANAEAITDAWLMELRAGGAPPREDLQDRLSGLLADVAAAVRQKEGSGSSLPPGRRDRLGELVDLCRERGSSLPRILEGITLLQDALDDEMDETIASAEQASPHDVQAVQRSLHRELGRIERTVAAIWADAETREGSEAVERFTSFSRALEHEMRGPLQTALGAVDLLERADDETPPGSREQLRVLEDQLERMTELLTEARRISATAEDGGHGRWVPVEEMVSGVFDELAPMAESKGVDLRVSDPDEEVRVRVPQVRVALRNLVANAIKYSDPAEHDPHVTVALRRSRESGCRLAVEDNGLGVPEGVEDRIFEPGVRAHPEIGSGAGLGLAIVREVLQTRGGTVSVEPVEEGGSRFVLTLPPGLAVQGA